MKDKCLREHRDLEVTMKTVLMVLLTIVLMTNLVGATVGDILVQINTITGGDGRGMAFDGKYLYYTWYTHSPQPPDTNIYKIDMNGIPIDTISPPFVNGSQPQAGPLAWDGTNIWTINYGNNGDLIQLTPTPIGTLVSTCNIIKTNPDHPALVGLFQGIYNPNFLKAAPDGLDWTGIPGSELVLSGEGWQNNSVAFMNTDCKIQSWFNVTSKFGGGTSGVAFDGQNLWQTYPKGLRSNETFVQTDLYGIDTGLSFGFSNSTILKYSLTYFEDLAYDPITFAPKCALWANDVGIRMSPILLPPRTNNITAFEIPCGPVNKISGGGWITIIGDPKATFGIEGQYPDSKSVQGNVEFQDHINNLNIKSTQINTVTTTLDKKKGTITGLATVNDAGSYPFVVYIEDNGEPGKDTDVFKISLPTYPYSNGSILSGGNIQIR